MKKYKVYFTLNNISGKYYIFCYAPNSKAAKLRAFEIARDWIYQPIEKIISARVYR